MTFAVILADDDTIVFGYTFRSGGASSEFSSGVMRWSLSKRASLEDPQPNQMPGLTFSGLLKDIAVSLTGRYLALILYATSPQEVDRVELLDARSWLVVCEFPAHTAAFDQQGRLLAVAAKDGGVTIVHTDTCAPEVRIHGAQVDPGLQRSPLAIQFVPEQNAVFTAAADPSHLQFWDLSTGTKIAPIFSVRESLPFDLLISDPVTFNPTGEFLATVLSQPAGPQDVLEVWQLSSK
jgi:WD40 repeat protein